MLSKSSKWDLGLIHYIAKFTISKFVISMFECTTMYLALWHDKRDNDSKIQWVNHP